MREHFSERIYLDQICRYVGLSKSTLLRAFTKSKGITPYRYLETIRINEAKSLLEKGVLPIDAAMQTGFSDQRHFTNYFSSFIGITPGIYREIFLEKNREGKQYYEICSSILKDAEQLIQIYDKENDTVKEFHENE